MGGEKNIFDSFTVPGNNVACIYDINSSSGFITGLTGQIYEKVTETLAELTACMCEAAQADKQCHPPSFRVIVKKKKTFDSVLPLA